MDGSFDLSKIISVIAENPELVNTVKGLLSSISTQAEKSETEKPKDIEVDSEPVSAHENETEASSDASTVKASTKPDDSHLLKKRRRKELLCALKPYVCHERSRAIDTMLSLSEVLEVLKEV